MYGLKGGAAYLETVLSTDEHGGLCRLVGFAGPQTFLKLHMAAVSGFKLQ